MRRTAKKHHVAAPARNKHQVRIIGGQWKRTPLPVLQAESLRPTPDRVRETVFNWLTHLISSDWAQIRCLDLFAGSGALGFEAASRGARHVVMLENHAPAVRRLEISKEKLRAGQVEIQHGDALALLRRWNAHAFDLIFADPPYHQNWLAQIMPACERLLAERGLVYVESEQPLTGDDAPDWMASWKIVRADRAGLVFCHLLQPKNSGSQA
ncbi:MAG: 16S rRNA (guanine(966)-N(2))-methyltransferase RsmD [Herbaspirillum sp.]